MNHITRNIYFTDNSMIVVDCAESTSIARMVVCLYGLAPTPQFHVRFRSDEETTYLYSVETVEQAWSLLHSDKSLGRVVRNVKAEASRVTKINGDVVTVLTEKV